MRKNTVDGEPLLRRRRHRHSSGCFEELTVVQLREADRGRFHLRFRGRHGGLPGDPHRGMPVHNYEFVNLDQPAVVAALVREGRRRGWLSDELRVQVVDACEWLGDAAREDLPPS